MPDTPRFSEVVQQLRRSEIEMGQLRRMSEMWGTDFWTYEAIVEALGRRATEVFYLTVAAEVVQDGEWAAMMLASITPDFCDVLYVYVDPAFRGRGLGAIVLRGVADECRRRRIAEIRLEARAANVAARALYRKVGMVECARRRNYYSNGEDAVLYSWPLD